MKSKPEIISPKKKAKQEKNKESTLVTPFVGFLGAALSLQSTFLEAVTQTTDAGLGAMSQALNDAGSPSAQEVFEKGGKKKSVSPFTLKNMGKMAIESFRTFGNFSSSGPGEFLRFWAKPVSILMGAGMAVSGLFGMSPVGTLWKPQGGALLKSQLKKSSQKKGGLEVPLFPLLNLSSQEVKEAYKNPFKNFMTPELKKMAHQGDLILTPFLAPFLAWKIFAPESYEWIQKTSEENQKILREGFLTSQSPLIQKTQELSKEVQALTLKIPYAITAEQIRRQGRIGEKGLEISQEAIKTGFEGAKRIGMTKSFEGGNQPSLFSLKSKKEQGWDRAWGTPTKEDPWDLALLSFYTFLLFLFRNTQEYQKKGRSGKRSGA